MLLAAGWVALCCGSAAGVDARSPGKWLVDLGRDYPLTPQAGLSAIDAEIALLFMQAAARVEPDLAEAWRWQVDLLNLLHREAEVQAVLETYRRLAPDDVPAAWALTRTRLDALQTADARADFCRRQLAEGNLPRAVAGDLRYRLADFHWNRGEREEARQQAEAALRDDPYNLAARRFLADIAPPDQRWIHRVSLLVARLEVNPGDLDAATNLGDELRLHGLAEEAEIWYSHAQKLSQILNPASTPTGLLLARAAVLMELKRLDEAQELARQAVEAEPMTVDTLIVRAQVALLKGDVQSAESHFRLASKLCRSTVDNARATQASLDDSLIADLAWFFAHYDPTPDYAGMLSQTVLTTDPDNAVARRAAGALLLRGNQLADAERTLLPAADKDVWAAILLAEAYKKAGHDEEAASKLRELTTRPANFEQRFLIQSKCREWKVEPLATQPAVSAARRLAASIAPERRDYPFHPDRYLTAALSVPEATVLPGEPWWCTLRLANNAAFPITIGNGCMIEPAVLMVVETRGDRRRSSEGSLQILDTTVGPR